MPGEKARMGLLRCPRVFDVDGAPCPRFLGAGDGAARDGRPYKGFRCYRGAQAPTGGGVVPFGAFGSLSGALPRDYRGSHLLGGADSAADERGSGTVNWIIAVGVDRIAEGVDRDCRGACDRIAC